jgi:hypothetical protein
MSETKPVIDAEVVEQGSKAIQRLKRAPREVSQQLFESFMAGVDAQLDQGELTEGEQSSILAVLDEHNGTLAIRDHAAEFILACRESARAIRDRVKTGEGIARSLEACANRLCWSLKLALEERGIKKVTSEEHYFRVSKNPVRTIINEEILPAEYWKEVISRAPDKEKIESELDAGKEVIGAYYEQPTRLDVK